LKKEQFLELLENQEDNLLAGDLLSKLKELEEYCSKEVFNNLCYCLTLSKLKDHPDYKNWTIQQGRMECFEAAKSYLELATIQIFLIPI
jgi:hypothetical protein